MRYTLLVLSPPDVGASARHALGFAQALIGTGHELCCVFFYEQGVLNALRGTEAPQDELDVASAWETLAREHGIPLFACVASAARYGVGGAERLREGFSIAGLGELIDAGSRSDRLLNFAG